MGLAQERAEVLHMRQLTQEQEKQYDMIELQDT